VVSPLAEPDGVVDAAVSPAAPLPVPVLATSRAFATSRPALLPFAPFEAFAPLPAAGVVRVVVLDVVRFAFAAGVLAALAAWPVEPAARDGVDDVVAGEVDAATGVDAVVLPVDGVVPVGADAPFEPVVDVGDPVAPDDTDGVELVSRDCTGAEVC
jgi:hypothetical protein